MLSVKGIYENGRVKLLEAIPHTKRAKVIVTNLEEGLSEDEVKESLFDDLIGVVSVRENGSINHDHYIAQRHG